MRIIVIFISISTISALSFALLFLLPLLYIPFYRVLKTDVDATPIALAAILGLAWGWMSNRAMRWMKLELRAIPLVFSMAIWVFILLRAVASGELTFRFSDDPFDPDRLFLAVAIAAIPFYAVQLIDAARAKRQAH